MHTWVRRGLQTALVTGGLLMLGTGIASASENVNPDTPANPVDAGVAVPINIDQNQIGTPVGPVDTPPIQQNVSTDDITSALPADATDQVTGQLAPVVGQAGAATQDAGLPTSGIVRGNKVVVRGVVPIDICGNAVAAGGDATAAGNCSQDLSAPDPVSTDGSGQALAGNAAVGNVAVPLQVTGNAVSALGNAVSTSQADQNTYTGGDIVTDGSNGVLSGTIAAVQGAIPVQVANNAVAGGGIARANGSAASSATSDGSLRTDGSDGTGAGTAAGVPVGTPVQLDGNAVGGIGNAGSTSDTTANSQAGNAGASNIDWAGRPAWLVTNGDPSTASGTVAETPVSGPVSVDDNAASGIGNTTANSTNNSANTAGGAASTLGTGSVGSGTVANAPVALPSQAAGNGGALIGNAAANHATNVTSTAGGPTYSLGDNSTLSSTTATVPPAGAVDVCGNGAVGAGTAGGTCANNVTSAAGGYTGTSGSGSAGSGNLGQTPVAVPVETYGLAAAGAGTASATATETKSITSGGTPNAADDNGTLAANVISTPAAVPAQVFGDTAAAAGNAFTNATNDSTATAGGDPKSTGRHATGSGNIVQVPASVPAQVFGDTDTLVGNGGTQTGSATSSTAGGHAKTDGSEGAISGNVVSVPAATAAQLFGQAGSVGGLTGAQTDNVLASTAGGNIDTHGDGGALAGNAVTAPAMPIVQGYGADVAGLANSQATGNNVSMLENGGNVSTSGADSSVSGDILEIPAFAQASPYGDAVSALGNGTGTANNTLTAVNGGEPTTEGDGPLSGLNYLFPVGAAVPVKDTPVGVLGQAHTFVSDATDVTNGVPSASEFALPVNGSALPVDASDMPSGGELAPALNPAGVGSLTSSALSDPASATSALPGADLVSGAVPTQAVSGVLPVSPQFFPAI
ncbi:MAG TPA: hypothetical protein VG756_27035 [Pseudonocardiaceae bacterium]|jgi:hypothetical protein|nr:hypothetical protein [Pseudonocardiaceae bacterium]